MSFPIFRTARERWQRLERDDLHHGECIVGRYVGSHRNDGVWGPVTGMVALLLLEELSSGGLIWIPVIDEDLRGILEDDPPAEGDLIRVTCAGILALHLELLEPRSAGYFHVDADPAVPLLEPAAFQTDLSRPHVPEAPSSTSEAS